MAEAGKLTTKTILDAFEAAAAGAWIHGRAALAAPAAGMVASDLLAQLPQVPSVRP